MKTAHHRCGGEQHASMMNPPHRRRLRLLAAGQLLAIFGCGVHGAASEAVAGLSHGGSVLSSSSANIGEDVESVISTMTADNMDSLLLPRDHDAAAAAATITDRDLQDTRLWDISPPVISSSGMQLDLEHTVRDQVRTSNVRIDLFRDEACSILIDPADNNYLVVDIVNDLTAFGSGSGTRQMTVNYNINPSTISNSRIITFAGEDPIVSFCTRFNLIDPSNPNEVANFLDTPVAVRVDITQQFEILAILEDEEDNYGAEAFECDSDNNRILEPVLKTQGSRIRICIQPDSFTRDFGVVMRSVNQFKLIRGDVEDDIIVPDGVIQDLVQTQYRCTPGDPVCYLTTELSNRFFYSRGTVTAQGIAWLQYASSNNNNGGRRRGLIKVPFQVGASDHQQQQHQPAPPLQNTMMWNRQALEAGGFIGGRDFSTSFEVEPSGTDWEANSFLCNGRNLPLVGTELTRSRNKDDDIRVCVMPSQEARDRGVYVRAISSFYFEQGDLIQFSIQPSGQQADDTLYICNAGEPLCAFKIQLSDEFFDKNKDVVGVGEVLLQYGTEPPTRSSRQLQDDADPTVDAGFAGRTNVVVQFGTDPTYIPPSELTWQEKADEWWHETPLFLRIVYVMAAVIGFLILLCFLWAICCGNPFAKKKTVPEGGTQSRKIFIQPIFMWRNKNKDKDNDEEDIQSMDDDEDEPKDRDTAKDWEVPDQKDDATTNVISASRRLENAPMDAVPEAESAHFTATPGANAYHESFAKIEPDYSKSPKSPKKKSSRRFSAGDTENSTTKSPRRKGSMKMIEAGGGGGDMDSTKSPKRKNSKTGSSASKSPKPKPKSSVNSMNDGTGASVGKSPRTPSSRKKLTAGASPKSTSLDNSSALNLTGVSQRSTNSPKPRRSKRTTDSTVSSARSVSSAKSPLPRRGTSKSGSSVRSLKSPGGRHASLDNSARSSASNRKTPATAPAGPRRVATGDKDKKMPDVLPF